MSRAEANGLLIIAALPWGAGNVAQKTALDDIGPFTAIGLRCLIASLVRLPITLRLGKLGSGFGPGSVHSASVVVATFAIAATLYQVSAGLTSVTNAGFLVNASTVLTPAAAFMLLRHRPAVMLWPAAALTLTGAFLMSGGSMTHFNAGDGFALASAALYSLWMIAPGEFVKRYGNACLLMLAQFMVTGCACLAIGLCFEPGSVANLQNAMPELIFLGVVSTGIGYLLQAIAQSHTSASEAAVIISGEAVFGALCAFLLLGERLDITGFIGACLIFAGILTMQVSYTSTAPAALRSIPPNRQLP